MSSSEWSIGDIILDLYEVREVFTSGGMGLVYRVYHKGWNSDMAMKCPRPEYFNTESQKRGFEHEAETWMNLGLHPNIVSCYYVRRIGGVPCVFAEYLEGGSLRDCIRQGKLKSIDVIIDTAIQFATGLAYAHEKGLIHQDVKPANVMLASDGTAKVTDFGLARAQSLPDASVTSTSSASTAHSKRRGSHMSSFGGMTQAYCSCEQADHKPLSLKTDIWSWGVSILEIFIGSVTWLSGSVAALVLDDFLRNPPTGASIPHMPKPIAAILKRCFTQDPALRPSNMQEIIAELKQIYRDITGKDYPRGEYLTARLTADSLNNRAVSLLDLGRVDEAEGMWRESLRADPHHTESTLNLALYQWKLCTIAERDIFRKLEELMRSQPLKHRDYNLIGRMYMFFGEYGKALDTIWKGFKEGSSSPVEIKALVAALCAEGRHSSKKDSTASMTLWKDAERYSRQIIEGGSRDIQMIAAHSISLMKQGRASESAAFYDKMKADIPSLPISVVAAALGYLPGYEVIKQLEGHSGLVNMVILSADGSLAASAGTEDRSVRLWKMDTGECLATLDGHTDWVCCLCFSRDGATIISGGLDSSLRFWDVLRKKCVREVFDAHKDGVTAVMAAPDGRHIISGGNDAAIRIWSSGHLVRTLEGHSGRITSLAAGARGPYVVSAGSDSTIRIWNITTGKCLTTMSGHEGAINHIAKLDNSSHILTSSEDMTIRLWDIVAGKHIRSFSGHCGAVTAAAFMPNGRDFISGSADNTLCRWDIETGERQYVFKRFEGPSLALCPDGKTAVYSVWNGLRVINILNRFTLPYAIATPVSSEEAGRREGGFQTILDETQRLINEGALNTIPDLIRKGRQIKGYERDREALQIMERLSRVFPKKKIHGAWESAQAEGHDGALNAISVSKSGKFVVTGSADSTVALWETASMTRIKVFNGHKGAVNTVAISCDDRLILSGGDDATLRLWDLEKSESQWVFNSHCMPVTSAVMSHDCKYAVSGSHDGSVVLIDIERRLELRVYFERGYRVNCVVLTPDISSVIAGYENGSLQIWDIDSEECLASMKPYNNSVSSAALSPDLKYIVCTGTFENTFHIWDVGTKKLIRSFRGHTGGVLAAEFSSDGKFIVSGSVDGTLRLWETETGRVSRTFTGQAGGVNAVCFSPDSFIAYSGSADHMLRSYYIDWELEVKDFKDWDDKAVTYLEQFISAHTPFINNSFTRRATPLWNETDVEELLSQLSLRGFGWLRPEGVRTKLDALRQETLTRWQQWQESFNAAITQAKELMSIGSYTAALALINKARSIGSYKNEAEALRLTEEISKTFPRTHLYASLRLNMLRGHGGGITAAVFTKDERFAVTACKDDRVRVWELPSGSCVRILNAGNVTALLPLGSDLIVSGTADGALAILDFTTKTVQRSLKGHTSAIVSLSCAHLGKYLLSASKDGLMILWAVESGQRLKVFKCLSSSITCAAIDEDLAFIASASTDRAITIWDTVTGGITKTLIGHTDSVTAIAISPDGSFIVSGGATRRVRQWDVATGKNTAIFEGHSGAVTSLQISPDGRFFVSGSVDASALLWNRTQPGTYAAFGGHTAAVTSVLLSPSAGMMLTASDDRSAYVWMLQWSFTIRDFTDWVDGALPYLRRFLSVRRKLVIDTLTSVGSPELKDEDAAKLRTELRRKGFGWLTNEGISAKLWQIKAEIDKDWSGRVAKFKGLLKSGVDFMKDKQYVKAIESLSSAHALRGFEREEEPLRLLDKMHTVFPKIRLLDVWRVNLLVGHRGKITALAVFSDNRHAITASDDKTLRFWDIATGKCIRVFEGHTGAVTSLSLTVDNRSVVSAGADGTIRQWDVISGECVHVIKASKDTITAVVTVADNRRILCGSELGTLSLWDSFTGECISTHNCGSSGKLTALAISPDGMYYYSGGSSAEFWDLSTGHPIHKFKGPSTSGIKTITVTPNGRYILTAGEDITARLWDVPTGENIRTFQWHMGKPVSAAITPNGKYAVMGGGGGALHFYDISSGELSKSVHWHTGALTAIGISPDCRYIVTGGDETVAGVWYAYWQMAVKRPAEWDDGARPFLESFLALKTAGRYPPAKKPQWTDDDFKELLKELSLRGYGWLTTSGIKAKLDEMAANWKSVLSERKYHFEKEFRQGR